MFMLVFIFVSLVTSTYAMDNERAINDLRVVVHSSAVTSRDVCGRTPLHRAVIAGAVERVQKLIESQADIDARDREGHTAFFYACQQNNPDMAYLLRLKGANDPNPQQIDLWDETRVAIGWADAVRKQISEVILSLFRTWRKQRDDGSAIVAAVKGGTLGVNYQMHEPPHWSILHYAVQFDDSETIQFLVENGADVNIRDTFGHTPLHFAAELSLVSVKILVEHDANVDVRCDCGKTPLHHAAIKGKDACVQKLLEYKADVFMCDNHGSTPLHYAFKQGHMTVVEKLNREHTVYQKSQKPCEQANQPCCEIM